MLAGSPVVHELEQTPSGPMIVALGRAALTAFATAVPAVAVVPANSKQVAPELAIACATDVKLADVV
jgi:hypothetical protein